MRPKTDQNQARIFLELRQLGFSVHDTSRVGNGFPDCVVGDPRTGLNYLFEIKSKNGKLRASQKVFQENWRGQYDVIRSTKDALSIMAIV
jgi:hypothetical protein